jgi:hypothetical protein
LACARWVNEYNKVDRFVLVEKWRYSCRLLMKEFPRLAVLAEAFKEFGRRRLLGRCIAILDNMFSIDVDWLPGEPLEEDFFIDGEWRAPGQGE